MSDLRMPLATRFINKLRASFAPVATLNKLYVDRLASLADYRTRAGGMETEHARRYAHECSLASSEQPFSTLGDCFVCQKQVNFETDFLYSSDLFDGKRLPNWRERVLCPSCGLNNRMRASIQVLEEVVGAKPTANIYLGERVTPLYAALAKRFDQLIGSEYLGDRVPFGEVDEHGTRNESITHLKFDDEVFDFVLSFDVLEHVPDPEKGIREIFRVLAPRGKVMLSVPFLMWEQNTRRRAVVEADGNVRHLLEPQYHGDPLSASGCLCFQDFGWELLDQMRSTGFTNVAMLLYWSDKLGYYGVEQGLIVGEKAGRG
jgi:SAM-dependent methyltransferase